MAEKIDRTWLNIDTDAISMIHRQNNGGNSSDVLTAVIVYTEGEVTKRVQALPNSFIDDNIELDENGYYKSIVLKQFATNYCLYRIMLGYLGSGSGDPADVYEAKMIRYMKEADKSLPEITADTINNDGTEPVVESHNSTFFYM